jgi:hypothetical protein
VFKLGDTDVSYCCKAAIERNSSCFIKTGFVKFSEKYLYVADPLSKLRLWKNTNCSCKFLLFWMFDICDELYNVKRYLSYKLSLLFVSGVTKHSMTSFVLSWPLDRIGFDSVVKPPVIVKYSLVYLLKC